MFGCSSASAFLASRRKRWSRVGLLGEGPGQDLDGDLVPGLEVDGEEDGAHPARPQGLDEAIAAHLRRRLRRFVGLGFRHAIGPARLPGSIRRGLRPSILRGDASGDDDLPKIGGRVNPWGRVARREEWGMRSEECGVRNAGAGGVRRLWVRPPPRATPQSRARCPLRAFRALHSALFTLHSRNARHDELTPPRHRGENQAPRRLLRARSSGG